MLRTLIVEDSLWFRTYLCELLQAGYPDMRIVTVADGTGVIDKLDTLQPDVVFMDVSLPHRSGFEVTREILQVCPQLPVVVMASHDELEYREAARSIGAARFFLKDELNADCIDSIMRSLCPKSSNGLLKKQPPRWLERWTAAVSERLTPTQLGVALAASTLVLSIPLVLHPVLVATSHAYRTLATVGSMGRFASNDVLVVFADELPEGEMTSLLRSVRGRIVDGPSERNVYTVRLDGKGRSDQVVADALNYLRASKGVLLAERALGPDVASP